MRAFTHSVDLGIDPVEVGASTGMLWSGASLTLAGVGEATRIRLGRSLDAAAWAQASLAELGDLEADGAGTTGAVAFAAMPFDRDAPAELVLPEILLGCDGSGRSWVTSLSDGSPPAPAALRHMVLSALAGAQRDRGPRAVTVRAPIPPETWRDEKVIPVRDRIRAGELTKVVLARELVVSADDPIDASAVVRRLRLAHTAAMVFAVDGFVGASPELLVSRAGAVVRAHPLAGTAPRASDVDADSETVSRLLESTKDRWEHRITIDWLLEELLPFCSYVDADPEPGVVSLANVHHLGTRVEGRLSQPSASVLELVAALHPTPAVGGAPQAAALGVIAEVEGLDRGRYAGPVGWVDAAGNGSFAVGIRSAEISGTHARLMAGVGVVAESDPEAELAETRAKFQAMLPALMQI